MLVGMPLGMACPGRKVFGQMLTSVKTQSGCVAWWAAMACQEWVDELLAVIRSFGTDASVPLARCSTIEDDCDSPEVRRCAGLHFQLLVSLRGCRLVTLSSFLLSLPWCFGGLLHKSGDKVMARLQVLSSWWETLQQLEAAGTSSTFFGKFVDGLVWPKLSWCRGVLLVLIEYKFTCAPHWTKDPYLLPWARGFHGSNVPDRGRLPDSPEDGGCFRDRALGQDTQLVAVVPELVGP